MAKKKNNTRARNQDIKALKQDVIEHIKGLTSLFSIMCSTCLIWWLLNTHCQFSDFEASNLTKGFMVVFVIQLIVFMYKLIISVAVTVKECHRILKEYY